MRTFTVVIVSILTSAATTFGLVYADAHTQLLKLGKGTEAEPTRLVPPLVGLQEPDARANIEALGWKLMVEGREQSGEVEPGAVLRQVPAAGEGLRLGEPIYLTFALAPSKVPELIGTSLDEARRTLEEHGYTVLVAEAVHSDSVAEGAVAIQSPEAGALLQKNERVTLTPSAGAGALEVPKLTGLALAAAQTAAEELGLKAVDKWISRAETPSRVVLRQSPEAGATVQVQSNVELVVNR